MNPTLIQNLISATAVAIVGIIAYLGRGLVDVTIVYLKAKLTGSQLETLKMFATSTIRALEQSPAFKELDGAGKKERAIVEITQFCQKAGIPVDHTLVDKVIEESVQVMRAELPDLFDYAEQVGS